MSETAAAASKKRGYTRRTTRDRVVDLLEQAIELVKARCVDPERNAAVAAAEKLAASKKEFADAVELKKKENLAATAAATVPVVTAPLAATAFPTVTAAAPATKGTKGTKATKGAAAKTKTLAPQTAAAAVATAPVVNNTRRVKKAPSCPGGPKAFNEFLKSKRDEVEAELGPNAKYPQVRARIAQLWKESCPKPPTQTRKVGTKATPGRVNAVVPGVLSPLGEVSASKEAEETETEPEVEAEEEAAAEEAAEGSAEGSAEGAAEVAAAEGEEANLGYEDLGIDPMFDMRKIRVDGRDLYMADGNSSLFDRNDEDDDPLGEFVGYLRDGEIVEQEAPNT